MKALRTFGALGAVVLAGCSSAPLALLNGSPQGVVVRYSQAHATLADAAGAAEKFCAQYGRKAVQGGSNAMTGDTFVSYSCQIP